MATEILTLNGIVGPIYKLVESDGNFYLYKVCSDVMGNEYLDMYRSFVRGDVLDVLIETLAKGYKKE